MLLILTSLIAEIGLRLLVTAPSNLIYDPVIGFRYRPHSEIFLAKEGFARNTTNELGLNDDAFNAKDRLYNALILGDSYTEARHIARELNFTSLTENELSEWNIVNAGHNGLHLLYMFEVAKQFAPIVKPNLIVLVTSNSDYTRDLEQSSIQLSTRDNKIIDVSAKPGGTEKLKEKFAWLIDNSSLGTHLLRQFLPIIKDAFKDFNEFKNSQLNLQEKPHKKTQIPPPLQIKKEDIFSLFIDKLQRFAPVAILYINQMEYPDADQIIPGKKPYHTSTLIESIALKKKIPFINTADYLVKQYDSTHQPPFGFQNKLLPGGHLNKNGHQAVSHALTDLIKTFEQGKGL